MDSTDFDSSENANVEAVPSYAGAVATLAAVLRKQFDTGPAAGGGVE